MDSRRWEKEVKKVKIIPFFIFLRALLEIVVFGTVTEHSLGKTSLPFFKVFFAVGYEVQISVHLQDHVGKTEISEFHLKAHFSFKWSYT